MPDMPSITIVKSFAYRGQPEEWSNTYHFSGTTPSDAAAWKALADAIIADERLIVSSNTSFVKAYGYVAGNENSVAQIDYSVPPNTVLTGTYSVGTASRAPGDVVATIRWYTGASSSRGKKIYCRKFFHDTTFSAGTPDQVYSAHVTAYTAFATNAIDGTWPGGAKYCGPQGAVLSTGQVSPYTTTRTLKRRGKRPPI